MNPDVVRSDARKGVGEGPRDGNGGVRKGGRGGERIGDPDPRRHQPGRILRPSAPQDDQE
jgi:hypothetical protein